MTPPAVAAPPQVPAAPRAAASAPAPRLRARAPLSRARAPRPPLLTARTLGISLALHLLLLLAVLLAPAPERRAAVAPGEARPAPQESVEYLDVGEWGAMSTDPGATLPPPAPVSVPTGIGAAAADSVPRSLPDAVFPDRVPAGIPRAPAAQGGVPGATGPGQAAGVPAGEPGGAGQGRSGPGRLGPELGDPRLVVRPGAVAEAPLSDQERYQRHFESRIQAVNDSIHGEQERRRRANDWTIRDRSGNRWGLDERGLVVGGRHVPTPKLGVGRPQRDREDEARRERDQRREIDRQEETIERERVLRDRNRATRDRNDREREQRRQGQGGGQTPQPQTGGPATPPQGQPGATPPNP